MLRHKMKNSSSTLFKNLYPILWQILCILLSIGFFSLILLNRSPNFLRPLSMSLRTGFGLVIPITAFLVYLAFRIPGKIGEFTSLIITMALFAMPLAGLWASGLSQTTVLGGLIPLYDAESYYIDALGLINGSKFSLFSARRPLFPGLLAVLLSWTNQNLMASLAILTAITGFACYYTAREIQKTNGAATATFILIIVFLFFRAHSGVSMSENLGVALGSLGFALLWQGAHNKSLVHLCLGIFITTLALNARAGAFFMLPILILWISWIFRGEKSTLWKSACYASLAVVLGFVLNLILTRIIALPSGVPFANFSYTLYGLASGGKSWAYIFEAHPEILSIQEPEQTKRIYQLAFELIRTNPLLTIQGALFNWRMLFSDSWYNIYTYVGGENWKVSVTARWIMYLLCTAGIYSWFQDYKDPINSLVIASFFGVFISVPFLPPTDAYRMRPYAASILILAALPALGLDYVLKISRLETLNKKMENVALSHAPLLFSLILTSVTLAGPVVLRSLSTEVSIKPTSCTNSSWEFVISRFDDGTYINIKRQSLYFLDWMPDFHAGQLNSSVHSLVDQNLINWVKSLEPPTTLFYSLDINSGQKALIAFKTDTLPPTGYYYQFCGNFEPSPALSSYRIFYANEALPLSP